MGSPPLPALFFPSPSTFFFALTTAHCVHSTPVCCFFVLFIPLPSSCRKGPLHFPFPPELFFKTWLTNPGQLPFSSVHQLFSPPLLKMPQFFSTIPWSLHVLTKVFIKPLCCFPVRCSSPPTPCIFCAESLLNLILDKDLFFFPSFSPPLGSPPFAYRASPLVPVVCWYISAFRPALDLEGTPPPLLA